MASGLLQKLAQRLFPLPEEQSAFLDAVEAPPEYAPCVLWTDRENAPGSLDLPLAENSPAWLPEWVLRLERGTAPGKHPGHDLGAFYCLDFSSIFAASALLEIPGPVGTALDLCAAPGGKTLFTQRCLEPEVLLANEVIGKRLGILRHNLSRCHAPRTWTQRLDPADWAAAAPLAFDAVIVDAPCSGQSLLVKGIENQGCFHPNTVNHNARRQRRILSAAAATVAPGGWLLYCTCTFAIEENEKLAAWFLKRHPHFQAVPVPHLESWRSNLADFPAYRLYPQSGLGAGSFAVLMRRSPDGEKRPLPPHLLGYPVYDKRENLKELE